MAKEKSEPSVEEMRHTAAHVLAAAARELKPDTKLGIGPHTENGFFHDVQAAENWTEQELPKLEKKMKEIKKRNLPIVQKEVSKDEARQLFKDDPFKLELIKQIEGVTVGVSDMGNGWFVTLCEGDHAASTGQIGEFKLTHLSGVYWQGDESKSQLQRIFGVQFATKQELTEYLARLEDAKKRDHRKIGQELDLFTFSPLVGAGLPMFTPRGTLVRDLLENFVRILQEAQGYEHVLIPHITKKELYETSGHWEKFKNNLFHVKGVTGADFVMKPMNCPHHTQIYASRPRSYRDLPIRYAETTMVYRDEQAGELQGLARVRSITQDDGHVFCRPDQIKKEISRVLSIINEFYSVFDFKLSFRLSLHDPLKQEQYLGSSDLWQQAEENLRAILKEKNIEFIEAEGEAAFYGPKIDFTAKDAIGRKWQLATIQLDFNMPARFNLSYVDNKGNMQRPVMIHRAVMGATERFLAILLEHYAGALPLWLSPTQVKALLIADSQLAYAQHVTDELRGAGIRVELDDRAESIGKKIREAQMLKVPVMLIIGKKEEEEQKVALRRRETGDQGVFSLEQIKEVLTKEIRERR